MKLKVYNENGRHVSSCEVASLHLSIDEVRDIYAKGCGHTNAESMSKCGFPVEAYTFTSEYYVTYGCGSNLNNCFSKVEVPYDVSPSEFVQSQIGQKYAFIYNEAHWVRNGITQEQKYGLAEVELQPQVSGDYLLVFDKTSKVLKSDSDYMSLKKLAGIIHKAGGEVTIFKAIKC